MYKEKDLDAQPRAWLVEGNSSRSAQLTGLGKYVLYEVQVLAFTRVGDGSPSHPPVLERTLDDGEFEPLRAWGRRGAILPPAPLGSRCAPKRTVASGISCGQPVTRATNPTARGCR